ncbi:hypothetical protein POM88_046618 [Heracleum sosnowskyi]|uniref:Uncharacterized protein n=1 Tax=Heracleum sosnowskyi TaxID=360622 RepID=A0AAD8H9B8_9APIA|nr:hypothetical protein POM88_046618 [Heracleum sosnowskyi]
MYNRDLYYIPVKEFTRWKLKPKTAASAIAPPSKSPFSPNPPPFSTSFATVRKLNPQNLLSQNPLSKVPIYTTKSTKVKNPNPNDLYYGFRYKNGNSRWKLKPKTAASTTAPPSKSPFSPNPPPFSTAFATVRKLNSQNLLSQNTLTKVPIYTTKSTKVKNPNPNDLYYRFRYKNDNSRWKLKPKTAASTTAPPSKSPFSPNPPPFSTAFATVRKLNPQNLLSQNPLTKVPIYTTKSTKVKNPNPNDLYYRFRYKNGNSRWKLKPKTAASTTAPPSKSPFSPNSPPFSTVFATVRKLNTQNLLSQNPLTKVPIYTTKSTKVKNPNPNDLYYRFRYKNGNSRWKLKPKTAVSTTAPPSKSPFSPNPPPFSTAFATVRKLNPQNLLSQNPLTKVPIYTTKSTKVKNPNPNDLYYGFRYKNGNSRWKLKPKTAASAIAPPSKSPFSPNPPPFSTAFATVRKLNSQNLLSQNTLTKVPIYTTKSTKVKNPNPNDLYYRFRYKNDNSRWKLKPKTAASTTAPPSKSPFSPNPPPFSTAFATVRKLNPQNLLSQNPLTKVPIYTTKSTKVKNPNPNDLYYHFRYKNGNSRWKLKPKTATSITAPPSKSPFSPNPPPFSTAFATVRKLNPQNLLSQNPLTKVPIYTTKSTKVKNPNPNDLYYRFRYKNGNSRWKLKPKTAASTTAPPSKSPFSPNPPPFSTAFATVRKLNPQNLLSQNPLTKVPIYTTKSTKVKKSNPNDLYYRFRYKNDNSRWKLKPKTAVSTTAPPSKSPFSPNPPPFSTAFATVIQSKKYFVLYHALMISAGFVTVGHSFWSYVDFQETKKIEESGWDAKNLMLHLGFEMEKMYEIYMGYKKEGRENFIKLMKSLDDLEGPIKKMAARDASKSAGAGV